MWRGMVAWTMVGLLAVACSGTREVTSPTTAPSPVSTTVPTSGGEADPSGSVVTEAGTQLTVRTPAGAELRRLPGSIDGGQPTWSRNGSQLVWSSTDASGGPLVAIIDLERGAISETPAPFFPFYYSWSPTGTRVGMLGNGSSGTIEFAILDLEEGDIRTADTGAPFYFDWSPDGASVVTHIGNERLVVIDAATGNQVSTAGSTGLFQAPQWTELGIFYQESTTSSIRARGLATWRAARQRSTTQRLVLGDTETVAEEIARFDGASAFAVNGDQVAYLKPSQSGTEVRVKTVGGDEEFIQTRGVLAFQWSPDGLRLLVLESTVEPGGPRLRWAVWSNGELLRFEPFTPTLTFLTRYLPFWDQYNRSISVWAPDSDAFVYAAAVDGEAGEVFVQRVAAGVVAQSIGPGEFASWSPGPEADPSS